MSAAAAASTSPGEAVSRLTLAYRDMYERINVRVVNQYMRLNYDKDTPGLSAMMAATIASQLPGGVLLGHGRTRRQLVDEGLLYAAETLRWQESLPPPSSPEAAEQRRKMDHQSMEWRLCDFLRIAAGDALDHEHVRSTRGLHHLVAYLVVNPPPDRSDGMMQFVEFLMFVPNMGLYRRWTWANQTLTREDYMSVFSEFLDTKSMRRLQPSLLALQANLRAQLATRGTDSSTNCMAAVAHLLRMDFVTEAMRTLASVNQSRVGELMEARTTADTTHLMMSFLAPEFERLEVSRGGRKPTPIEELAQEVDSVMKDLVVQVNAPGGSMAGAKRTLVDLAQLLLDATEPATKKQRRE